MQENIPAPFVAVKNSTPWRFAKDPINKEKLTNIKSLPSPVLGEISEYLSGQDKTTFALLSKKTDKAVYKKQSSDSIIQEILCKLSKINDFSCESMFCSKDPIKEKFDSFIKLLSDYNKQLIKSSDEKQRTTFMQGMVSLITSPENFKKNITRSFSTYCHRNHLYFDDILSLVIQYLIHKNAERLRKHSSSEELGTNIQAYTNSFRTGAYRYSSVYFDGGTLNKIQSTILAFQRKENKTTNPAKKGAYARELSQQIRSISAA